MKFWIEIGVNPSALATPGAPHETVRFIGSTQSGNRPPGHDPVDEVLSLQSAGAAAVDSYSHYRSGGEMPGAILPGDLVASPAARFFSRLQRSAAPSREHPTTNPRLSPKVRIQAESSAVPPTIHPPWPHGVRGFMLIGNAICAWILIWNFQVQSVALRTRSPDCVPPAHGVRPRFID